MKELDVFWVLESSVADIYTFKNINGKLKFISQNHIKELEHDYARSFSIIDGYMYIPAMKNGILKIDYTNFNIVNSYKVPENIAGMNFITKIGDYFYITIYTDINFNKEYSTFIRVKDLSDLDNSYEIIYELSSMSGAPYFISYIDGYYYITELDHSVSSIKQYKFNKDKTIETKVIYHRKHFFNVSRKRYEAKYSHLNG